jgi:hypothetical protein
LPARSAVGGSHRRAPAPDPATAARVPPNRDPGNTTSARCHAFRNRASMSAASSVLFCARTSEYAFGSSFESIIALMFGPRTSACPQ